MRLPSSVRLHLLTKCRRSRFKAALQALIHPASSTPAKPVRRFGSKTPVQRSLTSSSRTLQLVSKATTALLKSMASRQPATPLVSTPTVACRCQPSTEVRPSLAQPLVGPPTRLTCPPTWARATTYRLVPTQSMPVETLTQAITTLRASTTSSPIDTTSCLKTMLAMNGTSPIAVKKDTIHTVPTTQRSPQEHTPTTVVAAVPHLGTATTMLLNRPEITTAALTATSTTSTDIGLAKHLWGTPTTTKLLMSSDSIGNKRTFPQQETSRLATHTSTGVLTPRPSTSTVFTHHLKATTDSPQLDQVNPETSETHQAMLLVDTPTTTASVKTMPTPTTWTLERVLE